LEQGPPPHVILVVGVNGTGKTTTIGKLAAAKPHDAGLSVTLGAGDTFRTAAIEQLKIWADRMGSAFVGTTRLARTQPGWPIRPMRPPKKTAPMLSSSIRQAGCKTKPS